MNRGLARFIGDMFDFFADHASFLTIVGAVCFLFGPSLLVVLERKERLPRVVVWLFTFVLTPTMFLMMIFMGNPHSYCNDPLPHDAFRVFYPLFFFAMMSHWSHCSSKIVLRGSFDGRGDGDSMVEAWLEDLMTSYNRDSHEQRAGYLAQVHMPGEVFQSLVWWALQALPDEILVGIDIDAEKPHRKDVETFFEGDEVHHRLFQGRGDRHGQPHRSTGTRTGRRGRGVRRQLFHRRRRCGMV